MVVRDKSNREGGRDIDKAQPEGSEVRMRDGGGATHSK
jgi:hypothetical protein